MADHPAPTHLASEGKRFWTDVVAEYGEDLEPFELQLLRLACEALDRGVQSRKALRRHGLTYVSPQGAPVARPEVALEKASRAAFAQLVKQLGLGAVEDEPEDEPEQGVEGGRVRPSSVRRRRGQYAGWKAAA